MPTRTSPTLVWQIAARCAGSLVGSRGGHGKQTKGTRRRTAGQPWPLVLEMRIDTGSQPIDMYPTGSASAASVPSELTKADGSVPGFLSTSQDPRPASGPAPAPSRRLRRPGGHPRIPESQNPRPDPRPSGPSFTGGRDSSHGGGALCRLRISVPCVSFFFFFFSFLRCSGGERQSQGSAQSSRSRHILRRLHTLHGICIGMHASRKSTPYTVLLIIRRGSGYVNGVCATSSACCK